MFQDKPDFKLQVGVEMIPTFFKRLCDDRAAVFLEYAMLLAFVGVVGCAPLLPGGPVYGWLQREIATRFTLISMPFF